MKKTIRNIIIILLILIILGMAPYIILKKSISNIIKRPEFTQDAMITIYNNGKINVKEEITLIGDENMTYHEITIRKTLFVKDESDNDYEDCMPSENVTVYLNDKLLGGRKFDYKEWYADLLSI